MRPSEENGLPMAEALAPPDPFAARCAGGPTPNCIVPLTLEALSMLLGGLKVFDVRVAQRDTWRSDFEVLVHNPNYGPTPDGAIHPSANVTITGPMPQVAFEP